MFCIARVRVWQGGLEPMPQQGPVSLPVTESTATMDPGTRPSQQAWVTSQKAPDAQLGKPLQVVRQARVPHPKGLQSVFCGWLQLPCPSQTLGVVRVSP